MAPDTEDSCALTDAAAQITVRDGFHQRNLAEDLSLADLAKACQMSVHHFSRTFKQATGFASHRYVLRERVERAKRLLSDTALPLAQIALPPGFNSHGHFPSVFRRLVGTTPRVSGKKVNDGFKSFSAQLGRH